MAYNEEKFNDFLNSRVFLVMLGIAYLFLSYYAFGSGKFACSNSGNGIFFSLDSYLASNKIFSYALNLASGLGIITLIILLNKKFNFVRAVTSLNSSVFIILQLACPYLCVGFNTGLALCLVAILAQFVLYTTFGRRNVAQQEVYLVFAVLAFCCMFHYAFVALLIAFFIGFIQMQVMGIRGILAALFGVATPFWIAFGLGLIDPTTAMLPAASTIWETIPAGSSTIIIVSAVIEALIAILLVVANIFKILNYRLQLRAYNGFYIVLTIVAVVMMMADYRNMLTYVVLINYCLAVQVAQAFTIYDSIRHRYILVLFLLLGAAACYVAQVMM